MRDAVLLCDQTTLKEDHCRMILAALIALGS